MTVAIAIDIGTDCSLASSPGRFLGAAHGAGRAETATLGFSPSALPAAESFRAGWQSLLASIGAGQAGSSQSGSSVKGSGSDSHTLNGNSLVGNNLGGFNNSEAEADQKKLSAGSAPAEASAKSLVAIATLTMGESLRLSPGSGQGSGLSGAEVPGGGSPGAGLLLSSAVAHAGAFVAQPVVVAAMSSSALPSAKAISTKTSTRSEEKKPAAVGSKSADKSTPAQTTQAVHDLASSEVVQAAAVQGPVPAAVASLPQSVSAPVIASSVARSTNAQAQSAQADLPAALPDGPLPGFAATSHTSHTLQPDGPSSLRSGEVPEAANDAANKATGEPERYAKQGQAVTMPSLSGSSGRAISDSSTPAFKATASPNVQDDASLPVATFAEGGTSPKISALGRNQARTGTQSQSEIPAQPASQEVAVIPAVTASAGLNSLPGTVNSVAVQSGQLSAVASSESKTGVASGGRSPASGRLRSVRTTVTADSVQPVSRLVEGQASAPAVDASAMTRDQAGALAAVNTAGASSVAATGPDSREVFAALDAGGAPGRPTWIHAGAQRAEAGFQDPALGWVGVRADSSSGGVRAELVAGSADAAQALSSHMAGLNAYLAERHTPVESLTLAALQGGSSGAGSDRGAGEGMQQGTGQQTGQGAESGSSSVLTAESGSPSVAAELPAPAAWQQDSAQAVMPGGVHISVMA